MTRIDFYLLEDPAPNARARLACRLAEKAYLLGHSVYLHTGSEEQARALDELLWSFKAGSFVPHALRPAPDEECPPVVIGYGEAPAEGDLLINVSDALPRSFSDFARIAEVVDQEQSSLQHARERFRHYRAQGYQPGSHKLSGRDPT